MNYIAIFIGGGIGSLLRYFVGVITLKFYSGKFPFGTFLANLIACIVLGLIISGTYSKSWETWQKSFVVIGICGGFSTFSTFSNDSIKLFKSGDYTIGVLNILINIIFSFSVIYFLTKGSHEA